MGSLFKPSVPKYSPVTYTSPVVNNANEAEQTEQINPTSNDEAIKNVIKRTTTRGRSSLVQTSYRGVLNATNPFVPQRKNLLGE